LKYCLQEIAYDCFCYGTLQCDFDSKRFKTGFIILRYEIRIEGSEVLYGTLQSIPDEQKVETELNISKYEPR